jgi:hypothetical protein
MSIAQLVLEFLKVLLSWPAIVLALGILFLIRFKDPVNALLHRISALKLPGGSELLLPQATMNVLAGTAHAEIRVEAVGQAPGQGGAHGVGDALVPAQPTGNGPPDAAAERLRNERERAYLWEYRFLNYFLAPRTQIVLEWLANRQPTTYATYDTWVMGTVADPVERNAMIDALRSHHLVDIDQELMRVTEKGREYIEWRGPLNQFLRGRFGSPPPATPPAPILAPAAQEPDSPQ